jgi:hypothetical protein
MSSVLGYIVIYMCGMCHMGYLYRCWHAWRVDRRVERYNMDMSGRNVSVCYVSAMHLSLLLLLLGWRDCLDSAPQMLTCKMAVQYGTKELTGVCPNFKASLRMGQASGRVLYLLVPVKRGAGYVQPLCTPSLVCAAFLRSCVSVS